MAAATKTATYGVELKDGMSGPAADAATALKDLRDSMDKDTASLRAMQQAMKNLKSASIADISTIGRLKTAMDERKASLAKAQGAYIQLGGTFEKMKKPTSGLAEMLKRQALEQKKAEEAAKRAKLSLENLSEVAAGMPGPLGRVVAMFDRFSKLVGGRVIAAGIIAIAVGLVALVAATAKAAVNLYSYATAQANARRSELLRLEGLGKLWTAVGMYYGLAATSATQLQRGIDRVSANSALGRDKIAQYGEQLYKMGLRGKNWESALEGMSIKASVQGDAQAQMFASWAAGLSLTGGSVERLTNKVKAQIGGIAKAQMLDADVQAAKLQERFAAMYASLKIEPLLKAKAAFNDLFSQSTASGRALTALMGRIVQPLIDAMAGAWLVVKHFFQDLIIWELGLEISYLRLRNAFKKAFSAGEWKKLIDECSGPAMAGIYALGAAALYFGVPALWSLAGAAAGAAASLATLVGGALVAAAPFLLIGAAIWGAIEIVKQLWDLLAEDIDFSKLWEQIKTDFSAIQWSDIGLGIIEGIASGILPGPVLDSLKSVAKSAVTGLKSLLGIASPSRVFAALGETVPEGFAKGIDQGQPKVAGSVGGMASVPKVAPAATTPPAAGGGAARGGIRSVTIRELHFHASDGSKDARNQAEDFRTQLENALQDLALEMGAA